MKASVPHRIEMPRSDDFERQHVYFTIYLEAIGAFAVLPEIPT